MPIKINKDSMSLEIDGAVIVMREAVSRLMAGRPTDGGFYDHDPFHDLENRSRVLPFFEHVFY